MKYECEWNWEHYTALHTVFDVNAVRTIGQVDEMELDEMETRYVIRVRSFVKRVVLWEDIITKFVNMF